MCEITIVKKPDLRYTVDFNNCYFTVIVSTSHLHDENTYFNKNTGIYFKYFFDLTFYDRGDEPWHDRI